MVKYVLPKNQTGYEPCFKAVPLVKKRYYEVIENASMTGDQPKEFVKVYDYPLYLYKYKPKKQVIKTIRHLLKHKWNFYIVKSAEKWYPNETITEYLLNRLGECLGLNMSESFIARVGQQNQIRFFSQYFLKKGQELTHGADIYTGYLNDRHFVEDVEEKGLAQSFFTVQFTEEVLAHFFPKEKQIILENFVKMLLFDAYIGNNDRHYYNWGVIESIKKKKTRPFFAPIYDTARGLWWNKPESKIAEIFNYREEEKAKYRQMLDKYCKRSKPKIGWINMEKLNHFDLVELISQNSRYISKREIKKLFNEENLQKCIKLINSEFATLLSKKRRLLIIDCLKKRHQLFVHSLK